MPTLDAIYQNDDFEDETKFEEREESLDLSLSSCSSDNDICEKDLLLIDGTLKVNEGKEDNLDSEDAIVPDPSPMVYVNCGTGVGLGIWHPSVKVMAIIPDEYKALEKDKKCGSAIKAGLVMITLIGFGILGFPPKNVVFEEYAIGDAINCYYKGKFSLISEPPLTLLIYYLISRMTSNYTGDFIFEEIGQQYKNDFPYVNLRTFNRLLGLLSIYISFLTLKKFAIQKSFIFLGTLALILENSFNTQFAYFLSQPIVHFFTVCSIYFWKQSYNYNYHDYLSISWFKNIIFTSISLGGAMASRNFGGSTCVFIVFATLYQLWWTLTDTDISIKRVLIAYFVKLFLIIFIPLLIFISSWLIHLHLIHHVGRGDYEMSGAFQSSFVESTYSSVPAQVSYGSFITIRNDKTSGYLHSHHLFYPTASYQQQVSLYQFKDVNNVWLVEPSSPIIRNDTNDDPWPVSNGDIIRLLHVPTNRHLHSHGVKGHISEQDWVHEVSAYGADGYPGDINDFWMLEIVEKLSVPGPSQEKWQAIRSVIRLRHVATGCYLFSHRTRLPSWGMDQFEVTCTDIGRYQNSLWMVESNFHPGLNDNSSFENMDFVEYPQLNLAEKFLEYTAVIDRLSGSQNSDREISRSGLSPYEVPFLPETVKYLVMNEVGSQVNLFGNIINWYMAIVSIGIYIAFKVILIVLLQRNWVVVPFSVKFIRADHEAGHLLVAWLVHFIRLFSNSDKNIDISDYLPSLYFSILFSTVVGSWFFEVFLPGPPKSFGVRNIVLLLWGVGIIWGFVNYLPLMNGTRWNLEHCKKSDFGNWGFQCFIYSEEFQQQYNRPESMIGRIFTTITQDASSANEDNSSNDINDHEIKNGFTPRLDIHDPAIRDILVGYLKQRQFHQHETFLDLFPELNDTVIKQRTPSSTDGDTISAIKIQWSRITIPPKLNDTAIQLNI